MIEQNEIDKKLEDLSLQYDLYHSKIINQKKVRISILYDLNHRVSILLEELFDKGKKQESYVFENDEEFHTRALPKLLESFLSKNTNILKKTIWNGNHEKTLFMAREDLLEMLVIKNCSSSVIELVELLEQQYSNLLQKKAINLESLPCKEKKAMEYLEYNICLDYAWYKKCFWDFVRIYNDYTEEINEKSMSMVEIAKMLCKAKQDSKVKDIYEQVEKSLENQPEYIEICEKFKEEHEYTSLCARAMIYAEYELNNAAILDDNELLVEACMKASSSRISYFSPSFVDYWQGLARYYELSNKDGLIRICNQFMKVGKLSFKKAVETKEEKEGKKKEKMETLENDFDRPLFAEEIHEPIEILKKPAREKLSDIVIERDQIKKDAEEFAKMLLQQQREKKELLKAAEEQAKRIFALQQENMELKRFAEETAKGILEKEFQEKLNHKGKVPSSLQEIDENVPISEEDYDTVGQLLTALSQVKKTEFLVNHPTIMEEIFRLEEKIGAYFSSCEIEKREETNEEPFTLLEQKKTPTELMELLEETYQKSHEYEKEGNHTVMKIEPDDFNRYYVSIFSVKEEVEDMLLDTYFDEAYFYKFGIEKICNIFKEGRKMIANKTDNLENGKQDFIVIDDHENMICFSKCRKDIVMNAKCYL